MSVVNEIPLPGIGVRYEFVTHDGDRVAVVHHRSGVRELVLFERDDPDTSHDLLRLGPEDGRTLAELLGVSQVAKDLAELERDVEGLAVDRLPLGAASPFDGDEAHPAPGPEFALRGGDTLVVVGTPRGIEELAIVLRPG
jgi:TrkA domain protein